MWGNNNCQDLVGKKVTEIRMDEDHLRFLTDDGSMVAYELDADCCSSSYFYDFFGVKKLLEGGTVVNSTAIELDAPGDDQARYNESVVAYGVEIVVDDPNWGEVTAAFSFRNDSNGYYGGSLMNHRSSVNWATVPVLTDDCLSTEPRG